MASHRTSLSYYILLRNVTYRSCAGQTLAQQLAELDEPAPKGELSRLPNFQLSRITRPDASCARPKKATPLLTDLFPTSFLLTCPLPDIDPEDERPAADSLLEDHAYAREHYLDVGSVSYPFFRL